MKNIWTHPKHKGEWRSSYQYTKKDRVFTLVNGKKVKSYESWQAAKRDGWIKISAR